MQESRNTSKMCLDWDTGWESKYMNLEIVAAILLGLSAGAGMMFWFQRTRRMKELKQLEKLTYDILNEREIQAGAMGEETLYGKIEYELVRVQEILDGRKEEAEKSRDEIQKLISEIAHQMRTPLTNMETYLGFMKDTPGEMAPEYVAALEKSEEKLHFLVESFIKMSRLEQHIIQIKKEEKDILQTVLNVLGQIQCYAEAKEIQFDITFPEKAVCAHDANWLGEALYNILENAVKYSDNGGKIEVTVSENEMFMKIRVRDYGLGISEGEEHKIFQRFYRGKLVTTQAGFGIGLYLAREIVNLHGGFLIAKRMSPGVSLEVRIPVC